VIALIYIPTNSVEVFLPLLLVMAILTGVRRNINVILICISFMVRNVEHFSMYLLDICTSAFNNCLFSSLAHLVSGLLILCGISVLRSLDILVINPLSDV
jgi:hypothetical protein